MNVEQNKDWMKESKPIDHLEVEICFQLAEPFYMGDPNNSRQLDDDKFYEETKLPSFARVIETMARTREVISNEQELANHYKAIVDYSSSQGLSLDEVRQYFWLRLWFWNTKENVHIGFPWYDTLSEMQSFFKWISTSSETEPFEDMDQGWQFDAIVKDDRVYLREAEFNTDEEYANISVPVANFVKEITAVEKRAISVITELTEELGVDVWTTHLQSANFGTSTWQPKEYGPKRYKASFIRRLLRLD